MEKPPPLPTRVRDGVQIKHVPAPLWVRTIAGAADAVLAGLLATALIIFVIFPVVFPGSSARIFSDFESLANQGLSSPELFERIISDPNLLYPTLLAQFSYNFLFFLYFLINEWKLKGGSFGKLMFRISTVRVTPEEQLSFPIMMLRAGLKAFFLCNTPILWITYAFAFLNRERRTLYDLITGTWVID